ncbi:MAG: SDR family oxidoreductase [Spongiibacteraceae bacterium]|nr:SDR family oxidoreductase [Spongiibacteraceae bacterium]
MNDILDLDGRIALVTGAGQGIGRQIALHLAAHNAGGIIVNDFNLDRAKAVAEEVSDMGTKAIGLQADVSDYDAVKNMVAEAETRLGKIGVLINNAGNAGANPNKEVRKPFWETGPETWKHYTGVNFDGVMNCSAAVIPGMIERNAPGRIITIISEASRWGDAGLEVYAGAKAGAAGFMRSVARTLGRHQITANSISIAFTATPDVEAHVKSDPALLKKMMANYVIRRPGRPNDIANMALFLASDASSWITGQTYPVSGGFTFGL